MLEGWIQQAWTVVWKFLLGIDQWSRNEIYQLKQCCFATTGLEFHGSLQQLSALFIDNREINDLYRIWLRPRAGYASEAG